MILYNKLAVCHDLRKGTCQYVTRHVFNLVNLVIDYVKQYLDNDRDIIQFDSLGGVLSGYQYEK